MTTRKRHDVNSEPDEASIRSRQGLKAIEEAREEEEDATSTKNAEDSLSARLRRHLGALLIGLVVMWVPIAFLSSKVIKPHSGGTSTRYFDCGITGDYTFLPDYTIGKICFYPSSCPQAKAFQWVQNHPDFENMPLWRRQQLLAVATLFITQTRTLPTYDTQECEWEEFEPNCSVDGQYQALKPSEANPNGPWAIPPEIALLSNLTMLEMTGEQLEGTIPSQLGELTALTACRLHSSRDLRGTIPRQFGRLSALKVLGLNFNRLTGRVPFQLGELKALEGLYLIQNQLTGRLPRRLWQLPALSRLVVSHNQLTGSLPTEMAQLSDTLSELNLQRNRFEGTLPSELGALTRISNLRLAENHFEGPIPLQALSQLTNLEHLSIQNNSGLTGSIPSSFCALEQLKQVWIGCGAVDCPCDQCECH